MRRFFTPQRINTMTPQQIERVKSTWAQVLPIQDQAAKLFYGRLFELDPSVKPMFPDDLSAQGRKLMTTINVAVNALGRLDSIRPVVVEMGRRHVGYGVVDGHYDTVGEALLWTLEQGLGDTFTPEVKEAWTLTYTSIADVMKEGAKQG